MGVLNITPDSFSDGGEFLDIDTAVAHAKSMIESGAQIIDVGGESTRPGALRVAPEEEQRRVVDVIRHLVSEVGALVSIDTMNSGTAAAAISAGAKIINDVSGGLADEKMFAVAAEFDCQIVISHWRGFSDNMDALNQYDNIAVDVAAELQQRVDAALAAGIAREQIVIDPGLGFAKNAEQNWQLLAGLGELEKLGLPILIGASRKRFIAHALDAEHPGEVSKEQRDIASAALAALLVKQHRVWGLRVHNVAATAAALKIERARGA